MKIKSNLLIGCKVFVVMALIWYLPSKVGESVSVINASAGSPVEQVAAPMSKNKNVHIYNTHQSEQYADYDVVSGANYLKEKLNNLGYGCDVEANDFTKYLKANQMDYEESYTVSKMYLEQKLETEGPYDLIIDFHRDSIDKDLSTMTYEGKNYVKVMFVVGETSGKYDRVHQISQQISDRMNAKIPGISRGVYVKQSHYNQGVSDNMVLIEVGAHQNTKAEVEGTVDILSQVLDEYLTQ